MLSLYCSIVLVGISHLCLALPPNLQLGPLESRQIPERCTDVSATVDASCWNALDVATWLNEWYPRTVCGPNVASDAKCCTPNEAWSTCFLRLSQPTSGSDCTELDSCNTYIPTISVDPSIAPQVHYVVYNIYKINRFFTTWFYATLFAKSQASDSITNIIQTINPPEKTNVLLNDILSALIAGLAFVSTPGGAAVGGIAAETSAVSTILTTALKQAPSVAKAIWPVGTTDSVIYQIGQLQEALGDVTDQLRDSINAGLQLVMTDMSAFQAFAANGAFSSPKPPSLQNETTGLQWGFTTFLVSKSLTENGWDALFTTPARVGSRDENGNIKEDLWWCSPKENGFCFFLNKSINPKGGDNILSKVINTGWTTGDLLFDGALTCLQEGKTEGVPVTLNAENQLDLNCLSRMNLCTSHPESHDKPIACPVPFVDGKCPYPACRD